MPLSEEKVSRLLSGATPSFLIDIPPSLRLRSLTLNPAFFGDNAADTPIRAMFNIAFMRGNDSHADVDAPVVWFEAQLSADTDCRLPELMVYISHQFLLRSEPAQRALHQQVFRSSSIVNAITHGDDSHFVGLAFGNGSRMCTAPSDFPTTSNFGTVAVVRPRYLHGFDNVLKTCYLCVPRITALHSTSDHHALRLALLPIDSRTRCPVQRDIELTSTESFSFWFPLLYPPSIARLTGDHRELVTIQVKWPGEAVGVELLSFPRVPTRFTVESSTPAYRISPSLPHDPAVWGLGQGQSFALEADRLIPRSSADHTELGIFLCLANNTAIDRGQRAQVWLSIFGGVFGSTILALGVESLLKEGGVYNALILLLFLAVFLLTILRLLAPPPRANHDHMF